MTESARDSWPGGSIPPDLSFERNGRSLSEWLSRLVSDRRAEREEAAEALWAMESGLPSIHTDLEDLSELPDAEGQQLRFRGTVVEALADPSFDTRDFLERFCAQQVACQLDWNHRVELHIRREDEHGDKFERIADRFVSDGKIVPGQENRFARLVAAYISSACAPDAQREFEGAETSAASGVGSLVRIFAALSIEVLEAPEALTMILDQPQLRREGLSALGRAGPAARAFLPRLLADLDNMAMRDGRESPRFDAAQTLAAVCIGHRPTLKAIADRLGDSSAAVRRAAAEVCSPLGLAFGDLKDEVLDRLRELLSREDEQIFALDAYASVGREEPEIRSQILALARPRPARPRTVSRAAGHSWTYDVTMVERGAAIDALGYFEESAEDVVPVLLAATTDFEEYDSDLMYRGPVERVANVCRRLGPAAAPVAPYLSARLPDTESEFPDAIVDALAAMGPAAAEVIPQLEAWRRELAVEWEESWPPIVGREPPIDRHDDPIGWLLQQLVPRQL